MVLWCSKGIVGILVVFWHVWGVVRVLWMFEWWFGMSGVLLWCCGHFMGVVMVL